MRISNFSNYIIFPFEYTVFSSNQFFWSKTTPVANFNVLLPHVRETVERPDNMEFYELSADNDMCTAGLMRMLLKDCTKMCFQKDAVAVRFTDRIYGRPRLVLCQSRKTGVLLIPIEYRADTLSEICEINYNLIKIDHQCVGFCSQFNSLQGKLRNLGPVPELVEAYRQLRELLNQDEDTDDFTLNYTLPDLRDALLSDFEGLDFYNPVRANLYTYMNSPEDNILQSDEIDLLRMLHGMGSKYSMNPEGKNEFLHTFTNIVAATSTECALLLTHASANNQSHGFFREFVNNSMPRYLLIYLLALVQQQMQISTSEALANVSADENSDSMHTLNTIYHNVARAQSTLHFLDISAIAHINKYYNYCMDSLRVPQYYVQNKDKIGDLYSVANHLVEKRRYGVNLVMTILLGVLTFFSTIAALIDFCGKLENTNMVFVWMSGLTVVSGIALFIIIYRKLR